MEAAREEGCWVLGRELTSTLVGALLGVLPAKTTKTKKTPGSNQKALWMC